MEALTLAMPSGSTALDTMLKQAKRETLLEAKRRLFLATPYESTPAVWYAVVLERMAKELE
jgi:hypothetical protein